MRVRASRFIAALVIVFFIPNAVLAASPYIPSYQHAASILLPILAKPTLKYYPSNQLRGMINSMKGNFGESIMNNYFTRGLDMASGKHWYSIYKGSGKIQGIDGLFMQCDSRGNITSILAGESKYGTSQQHRTSDGALQGSFAYNAKRLQETAQYYRKFSDSIRGGNIKLVTGNPPKGAEVTIIPISDKKSVQVWFNKARNQYCYSDASVDTQTLRSQSSKMSIILDAAADGRFPYKSRLFRTEILGNNNLKITITELNAAGAKEQVIEHVSGSYAKLPENMKLIVNESLGSELKNSYRKLYGSSISDKEIERLVEKRVESLTKGVELSKAFDMKSLPFPWKAALKNSAVAGLIGAGISAGIRLGVSLWKDQPVNFWDIAKDSSIGFASASGGFLTTQGIEFSLNKAFMTSSQNLITKMLPQTFVKPIAVIAGGIIASAIFSVGYGLAYGDWKQSVRMFEAGATATVASGVVVSLLGVTGWMSGGVSIAVYAGVSFILGSYWSDLDEKERLDNIEALLYSYDD